MGYSSMPELKKAFFLLMAHQFTTPVINELREIFTHFDVTNRGCLSAASFRQVLQNTGATCLQVERMLHALDKDDSGSVDWTEFIAAALSISMCGNRQLVEAAFAMAKLHGRTSSKLSHMVTSLRSGGRIFQMNC